MGLLKMLLGVLMTKCDKSFPKTADILSDGSIEN